MQAVYQQDLVLRQAQLVDVRAARMPGLEIVVRRHDRPAVQQLAKMLVDELKIQRRRSLVIVVAELVLRVLVQIEEIIVDVDRLEPDAGFRSLLADLDGRAWSCRRTTGRR